MNSNLFYYRKMDIEAAPMGDEIGMLDLASGKYYMLDSVGTDIWSLLETPMTFDMLIDALISQYAVERSVCITDTRALMTSLLDFGLICKKEDCA